MKKTLLLIILISLLFILIPACGQKTNSQITPTPSTPASLKPLDSGRRVAVEAALSHDPELASFKLKVEVINYDVTLKGQVETDEQKIRAEKIAYTVKDVKTVINQIQVISP
jgi:hypothetical protein